MKPDNPYTPFKPLETDDMFVDQGRVLDTLIRKLNMGQSCVVIGGEGMGKTSILRRLERECKVELREPTDRFRFNFIPVYFRPDVSRASSLRHLLYQIIETVVRDVKNCLLTCCGEVAVTVVQDLEEFDSLRQLDNPDMSLGEEKDCKKLLAYIRNVIRIMRPVAHSPRLLLLLDGLYHIHDKSIVGPFVRRLYTLLDEENMKERGLRAQISFVLTGTKDLTRQFAERTPARYLRGRASIAPLFLHVFEEEDSLQLITRPIKKGRGVELLNEIAARIHDLTGGYPLLLHIVMTEVWHDSESQAINTSHLEEYEIRLCEECEELYQWIVESISESNLFYPVLSIFCHTTIDSLSFGELREIVSRSTKAQYLHELRRTVKALVALGVVRIIERDVYTLSGSVFRRWFEPLESSRVDEDNYFDQITELGKRLEELIRRLEPYSADKRMSDLQQILEEKLAALNTDALQLDALKEKYFDPSTPQYGEESRRLIRDVQEISNFVNFSVPSRLRGLGIEE